MAGSKPEVVASAALPLDVPAILGPDLSYEEPAEGQLSRDQLLARLAGARGLIALLSDRIDRELLDAAPELVVVANFAVGYDNVDLALATERGVVVTNTPDVLTDATADFTFALLLAAARRIVEGDRWVRTGHWPGWAPGQHLGADVAGRTLGIVGLGRIGRAVAARARGFSMSILAAAMPGRDYPDEPGVDRVPVDELWARADFVSLHCPLTDDTRHIVDAAALRRMKPGAILVNTARGPCVDEKALAAALAAGEIAGAGLDVFEREPAVESTLLADPRVVLAPHAGSATYTARKRMGEICAKAVATALAGDCPETALNPEVCR
jgi:glyoxylate reductase